MAAARFTRSVTYRFPAPPEAVWPVLSDTARFNEAFGTARYRLEEIAQPDGSVRRLGEARFGPLALRWDELPFDWVAGRWFRQTRHFLGGPFRALGAALTLAPDETGTLATYTVSGEARGLAGRILIALGLPGLIARRAARLLSHAARHVAGAEPQPFPIAVPAAGREQRLRAAGAEAALAEAGQPPELAARLVRLVLEAPEADVLRLRPRAMARDWQLPDRAVIELCLAATQAGLLEMVWALLCPRCRGAKAAVATLDTLPPRAHCPSCNIAYERDFAHNVEVSFAPSPRIRPLASGEFCLSGPMSTPHVLVQVAVPPGGRAGLEAEIPPGPLRIRTVGPGPALDIDHGGGVLPGFRAEAGSIAALAPEPPGTVCFANAADRPLTFVVESRAWRTDALTAHQLTTMQAFRDRFGDQALRPGDEVAIRHITLMFTDLKGSTAFYERVGDGAAFRLVREHFAFLAAEVRRHDGAVVKTIGDAVMAAFAEPAGAVAAGLAIQRRVAGFNAGGGLGDIVIKLGLHAGPCIAVTLNERLDYFGSTVNLAARLQGESAGGDLVLSEALAADPAVAGQLDGLGAEAGLARLKGFDRPVPFRRVPAAALLPSAGAAARDLAVPLPV